MKKIRCLKNHPNPQRNHDISVQAKVFSVWLLKDVTHMKTFDKITISTENICTYRFLNMKKLDKIKISTKNIHCRILNINSLSGGFKSKQNFLFLAD